MKLMSPWFQIAALLSAIRHVICDLEAARLGRSSSYPEPFSPLTRHRFQASLPPEGTTVDSAARSTDSF
jgi:hypothetical protein